MATPQMQSQNRRKRDQTKKAIDLAMQSRWSDAIALNQSIIDDFPDDLEAYNRLGKALTEIGRIRDAKVAFSSSLSLSPNNPIARKNLDRLHQLDDSYSADSIFNEYNDHGTDYSSDSIWNEYSDWGNDYSSISPFNEYATDPPILIKEGEVVGKLTVKSYEIDGVDPNTVGKDCGWVDQ